MQRKAGNRATAAALLSMGQAKLKVGPADDRYEREADAARSEVLSRLRAAGTGSHVAPPLEKEETTDYVAPLLSQVQREASAVIGREGGDLDEASEKAINSARHSGKALPEVRRRSMESAFGADFGAVKVHSGPEAHALNDRVGALAFTLGRDIFLGRSAPDMTSPASDGLLAHELAHTIQQGASPPTCRDDEPTGSS